MSTPVPVAMPVLSAHPCTVNGVAARSLLPLAGPSSVIVVGSGAVTVKVAHVAPQPTLPAVARMVAVPWASGAAAPCCVIDATAGALELQRSDGRNTSTAGLGSV